MRPIPILFLLLALAACSTSINRPLMGDRSITPKAVAEQSGALPSRVIEWGGAIMDSRNLQDATEFQILAYPLQENGRPDSDASPSGRFIAVLDGYLETADYTPGRQVTLSGTLQGIRPGKVGEADYRFPVLQADEIMLWPSESASTSRTGVRFGIGIGSGGHTSGGVGIGIGF